MKLLGVVFFTNSVCFGIWQASWAAAGWMLGAQIVATSLCMIDWQEVRRKAEL